jgi:hypothetical protein
MWGIYTLLHNYVQSKKSFPCLHISVVLVQSCHLRLFSAYGSLKLTMVTVAQTDSIYLPITSAMYGQNFGTSMAMSSANSKNSFNLKQKTVPSVT